MLASLLELNKRLFLAFSALGDVPAVRDIVSVFADAPMFLVPFFLVGFWLYYARKRDDSGKKRLLSVFYATVVAIVLNIVIQHVVHVDRPAEFAKSAGRFILNHVPDASFPSDHASVGAAFVTALFLFGYGTVGYVAVPLLALMLVSRIIGGVHWPLDIFGGTVVGVFS